MDPIKELTQRVKRAGSQKAAAAELGVSQQYLNDIIRGYRDPGPMILSALGIERVVTYRRARP